METMASVSSLTSVLNWSVSQPRSRSPELASIEPSMPCEAATSISCWKVWPASVAWLVSMLNLKMLLQAVGAQEGDAAGDVEVVLVLGRLLRLGLDEELALEADALGVVDRHVDERGEVVLLALQVGVEERLVTLAAAPEDVVFAAELLA
jgi:hypothetical protein